ncbi:MAG: anti-sigma factor [Actinomycetota bacterium]|nr:anti-sigma factor [Actinomycetota bacterium]
MSDPRDCGADAGAYVLGALESREADAFSRHLDKCVVCRDEVATLQAVAVALPMAAPQLPTPTGLKRRALSGVRAESNATAAANRRGWLPLRARRPVSGGSMPFAAHRALAAGGLLAAAAITVGALQLSPGSAGPTRTVHASVINQGQFASAVLHVGGGQAELVVSHMPAPPSGKIYEVWLERPGEAPQPTISLFSVTSSGAGAVDVPGNLTGVSEVRVTPEPLGGSLEPTHAPVIVATLRS